MAFQFVSRPLGPLVGRRVLLGASLSLAAATACAQEADVKFQKSALAIVTANREIKFDIELATNDSERAHGLMCRKQLGAYEGMLFDFFKEMAVSFWTKNTLIPLD